MKVVILAGGLGTRLSEETGVRPKPMIEIGGRPILWHLMKIYSHYGFNDFIICLGYKGYFIREYFANYFLHSSNITIDLATNSMKVHNSSTEPWKITMVDTGNDSMTGGRLKAVAPFIDTDTFCCTYGDGLAQIDIGQLVDFHKKHGKLATVTAVQPPGRFGALTLNGSTVNGFQEKPQGDGGWINGGFFVLNKKVIDLIDEPSTIWEKAPMEKLAKNQELQAYFHKSFWQPMDTIRDKLVLENMWNENKAPWKVWP